MPKISVPVIARNVMKLRYPVDRCLLSVAPIADEFVFLVDPTSEDNTVDEMMFYGQMLNQMFGCEINIHASPWNMDNVSSVGEELSIQTNKAFADCRGDWILSLQCDEAIHEDDHEKIKYLVGKFADERKIDAYSMMRLYFYGDMHTVREDWSVPITRLFRKGTRRSYADAMDTIGNSVPVQCGVGMYHYSRIGNPEVIAKRIRSLDGFYHDEDELLSEDELQPYDFVPRNFDCMSKEGTDVGKKVIEQEVRKPFTGTHPFPFEDYEG